MLKTLGSTGPAVSLPQVLHDLPLQALLWMENGGSAYKS
jgi:hypothetical protein